MARKDSQNSTHEIGTFLRSFGIHPTSPEVLKKHQRALEQLGFNPAHSSAQGGPYERPINEMLFASEEVGRLTLSSDFDRVHGTLSGLSSLEGWG